jgi:hypothetical protein
VLRFLGCTLTLGTAAPYEMVHTSCMHGPHRRSCALWCHSLPVGQERSLRGTRTPFPATAVGMATSAEGSARQADVGRHRCRGTGRAKRAVYRPLGDRLPTSSDSNPMASRPRKSLTGWVSAGPASIGCWASRPPVNIKMLPDRVSADQRIAITGRIRHDAQRRGTARVRCFDGVVDRPAWTQRAPRRKCPGRTRCCGRGALFRPAGHRQHHARGTRHDPDGVSVRRAGKIDHTQQGPCRP